MQSLDSFPPMPSPIGPDGNLDLYILRVVKWQVRFFRDQGTPDAQIAYIMKGNAEGKFSGIDEFTVERREHLNELLMAAIDDALDETHPDRPAPADRGSPE